MKPSSFIEVEPELLREFLGYIDEARRWASLHPELLREEDMKFWMERLDAAQAPHSERGNESVSFLAGGGEMAARIREFDWSRTSLGPLAQWPQSLRTSVSLMLNSQHPMWIGWGPEMLFLYNDAYVAVLSLAKHPWALGRPAAEVWAEIWEYCGPLANKVFARGEASFVDDVKLFMNRGDMVEEVYYSFSYSPIRDESGAVGGLFCPSAEITSKVLNARRLATLAELSANALVEKTVASACASAFATLAKNNADIPFALFYLIDPATEIAHLAECTGTVDASLRPEEIPITSDDLENVWPVEIVACTGRARVITLTHGEGLLPIGLAEQRIKLAMALPVTRGEDQPLGVLIAGVNPARRLDAEYRTFFELVAGQLATAIQSARGAEEDRRRTEALAEIDRAKTAFFSNVSHELRTPLTLMLGPIEEILNKPEGEVIRENRHLAEVAHRNGLRLLKLVNVLLDFSRIEAGRVEAAYESTDLATLTADLASVFRAAIEKAGLHFVIDCPPLNEPAYVDREMWEKIVFNLLSNALKFTFSGEIAVRLREEGETIELQVSDTGAGIPAKELPRIFERFHRVRGAQSRTHEGTGIGLALVRELAHLHGGDATVESEEGRGSTFTITILKGRAHLPEARIGAVRTMASTRAGSMAFVDEAIRWLPGVPDSTDNSDALPVTSFDQAVIAHAASVIDRESRNHEEDGASRGLILLADDNADMRQYVRDLLTAQGYDVIAVPDGQAALDTARALTPDLVLADVMMPRLDGFELLRALRGDAATASVPIILLSARAGEEARVEGVSQGADDYLTKPFSARELLARVASHLELARVRKAAAEEVRASEERYRAFVENSSEGIWRLEFDPPLDTTLPVKKQIEHAFRDGRLAECNDAMARMYGLDRAEDLIGKSLDIMLPPSAPTTHEFLALIIRYGYRVNDVESMERDANGRTVCFANSMVGFVEDGLLKRMWGTQRDITERKQFDEALRQSEERFRAAVGAVSSLIWTSNAEGKMEGEQPGWSSFTGQTREEYQGYGWANAVHPEDAQPTIDAWEDAVARHETFVFEHRLRRHDGKWRRCSIRAVPVLNAAGEVREWVGVHNDITEQQEAEESLRAAKEEAESASRAKDHFLAQLSHELRTPLTPVLMTSAALREDDSLPAGLREHLAMIERNVALEARLIDDLLDLTRITRGKLAVRAEPCDMDSLINLAVEIVRDEAREKQVAFTLELNARRNQVIGDPARLQQVFWNLLRNAVKFTSHGGHVHIRSEDVVSTAEGDCGQHVRIQVSDDGIGFNAEAAERIFEPFFQAATGHGAGLGLGLAIARAIVDQHHGRISAASAGSGQGATFTIELPAEVSNLPKTALGLGINGAAGDCCEPPMHLLVVEDHEPTLQVLSRLLRRAGHRVTTASSVASALANATTTRFDAIISDLGLPDGTGFELMEKLRVEHGLSGIALSGYGMEEDLRRTELAGFVAHLVKPVDINELRRALRRIPQTVLAE
jgi:PAS domain S-box-containing protein